ncbi:hypothetical protein AVEN_56862-1 [Araneus ventricosus]|uniref:Uncharacterized protein n=1 Tax=Araneus ventricosus TaxID=182803 RepID=A0A4Y2F4Q5_ARAVE|nr:hypothetical protein AVEN_56862-1 [Araneus ventricosus]
MEQDRGCKPGDPIYPSQATNGFFLCPLLCGVLHYRTRTKPLEAYCHSCGLEISVRHPFHLFPALKSALSGCHFQSNEKLQKDVKNFLRSLGTDFYQDGFLKLSSLYDKCINVGG